MRSCVILLLALAGISGLPENTASKQAEDLEQKAQAAVTAGDQNARIAADLELFHLLNGSPIVVRALARAYASARDAQGALAELNHLADLGQTDESLPGGRDQRYASIQTLPEYSKIIARLSQNKAPISLSSRAVILPDAGLLPEDIDYDTASQSFLITSILKRKIIRVQTDGSVTDFAVSPDNWPMAAIKIDNSRGRVWATEVAFDGLAIAPASAWGQSAVLCFDLPTGKLIQRIAAPMHSSPGDMVLARDGDPIVSDGDKGVLYRVSNGRMLEINKTDFISPQTPTRVPSGEQLFVPDYVRGIARLDLKTKRVSWLNRDGADEVAVNGIDGLYFYGHSLIATQNGSSPERVAIFALDSTLTHIVSTKVIERADSPGSDATHGVIVGDNFFYIANSGWANLDEHGKLKDGVKFTKPVVMSYKLY
jgi:hypothetical protein